jgi:hypothetical protein
MARLIKLVFRCPPIALSGESRSRHEGKQKQRDSL